MPERFLDRPEAMPREGRGRRRALRGASALALGSFLLLLLPPALGENEGKELHGDPLPAGALARMGSARLKHGGPVNSLAFSPDGKTLASGSVDNTISLWEAATGKEVSRLEGHQQVVCSVAFSPDGKTLASGSFDKTIRLWDTATGKEVSRLEGHQQIVCSVAFSPDGKTLASGSGDNTIRLWEAATGKEVSRLEGHQGSVSSVAFSPDGKTLASGSGDNTIRLWEAATGKEVSRLEGHQDIVSSVVFSPDGKTLASGSADGTIRLWETATGRSFNLKEHQGPVRGQWRGEALGVNLAEDNLPSVAFSPDGKTLATWGFGGTIRLWDTATGKSLLTLEGHQDLVCSVAFSPDGKTLASGSRDTTLLVWDLASSLAGPPPSVPPPTAQTLDALWERLLDDQDARAAYRAIGELAQGGDASVRFLGGQLQPVPTPDAGRLASLIAQLEDASYEKRVEAQQALALLAMDGLAGEALRKALEREDCPAETRQQAEWILDASSPPGGDPGILRRRRAVQVLERVGTPEARALLRTLAGGAAGARLTRDAASALARLEKR